MVSTLKQINALNSLPEEEFFSREADIERLFHAGLDAARLLTPSLFLSGMRKSGRTEILKRVYNRLFWEQESVVPFFHSIPKALHSAEILCREYFLRCVLQFLAFQKKDPVLVLAEEFNLNLIFQLAYESRSPWLVEAVDNFQTTLRKKDLQALSSQALHFASTMSIKTGLGSFVLLDDFHHITSLKPEEDLSLLSGHFLSAFQVRRAPHLVSGASIGTMQRLFKTAELPGSLEVYPLPGLDCEGAIRLLRGLCERFDVSLEKDLAAPIVSELDNNPYYIRVLVQSARRANVDLLTARKFASLYTNELTRGNLHVYFSSLLSSASLNSMEKMKAIELLRTCARGTLDFSALHFFQKGETGEGWEPEKIFLALGELTLIDYDLGVISPIEDRVFREWIEWNFQHKFHGLQMADMDYSIAADLLKRMRHSLHTRELSTRIDQLEDFLTHMDCQSVPAWLFDISQANRLQEREEIARGLGGTVSPEVRTLPEIISLNPQEHSFGGKNGIAGRILIAQGFEEGQYTDDKETTWFTGFCASTEVVGLGEVEDFFRECQLLRRKSKSHQIQLWLVAEAHFNQSALSFSRENQILTSNAAQLEMLMQRIRPSAAETAEDDLSLDSSIYEMIIPPSEDAELVAVRALEQAAENISFDEKAKGQIRMAVMEACINAKEILGSSTGKIHLHFQLTENRLQTKFFVETSGFGHRPPTDATGQAWNLRLLQTLMDEVKITHTHFGLELAMVKFLRRAKSETGSH